MTLQYAHKVQIPSPPPSGNPCVARVSGVWGNACQPPNARSVRHRANYQLLEAVHRLLVEGLEQVPVDVEGRLDRAVTEARRPKPGRDKHHAPESVEASTWKSVMCLNVKVLSPERPAP